MNLHRYIPFFTAFMAGFHLAAAPYVDRPDGTRVTGRNITGSPDGTITLVTDSGTLTFQRGQYRAAFAVRPPILDQARQMLAGRQFEEAIPLLTNVARQFPNLTHDIEASMLLGRALIELGKPKEAIEAIERAGRANPNAFAQGPELEAVYWMALLRDKQLDKLDRMLETAIKSGSREQAARAQLVRGDIKTERGQHKEAVMDYLRTVILFKAQAAAQPEALYKTGLAFEQLRDSRRAKDFFQRVTNEFPDSPQAALAKGKL